MEDLSFGKGIDLMREAEKSYQRRTNIKKFEEVFGWSPGIQE